MILILKKAENSKKKNIQKEMFRRFRKRLKLPNMGILWICHAYFYN